MNEYEFEWATKTQDISIVLKAHTIEELKALHSHVINMLPTKEDGSVQIIGKDEKFLNDLLNGCLFKDLVTLILDAAGYEV